MKKEAGCSRNPKPRRRQERPYLLLDCAECAHLISLQHRAGPLSQRELCTCGFDFYERPLPPFLSLSFLFPSFL
jgi:hypothetical protein